MRGVVAVLLISAALAGCSSGGGKTHSVKATPETTASQTTVGAGTPKSASPGQTVTVPVPTTRGPDLTLTSFQSPSNNIGCEVDASATRCDIKERAWAPPPKPANCDLDWGQGIEISGTATPSFVCAGDTAFDPSATVLTYGQRTRQGSIVCDSQQAGVTCTNEASGHGFFMSRDSYRIF